MKFITPVAFECESQEQYFRLAHALDKLGLKESFYTNPYQQGDYINSASSEGKFAIFPRPAKDHYLARSEEEFLALASMIDDPDIKVGDWIKEQYDTVLFTAKTPGKVYFQRGNFVIKATKEEIIAHFDKKEPFYCVSSSALVGRKPCEKWCRIDACKDLIQPEKPERSEYLYSDYVDNFNHGVYGNEKLKTFNEFMGNSNLEPIFKACDTVYHWRYGEGEIIKIDNTDHVHEVSFNNKESFWVNENELSFTPYNLVDGGFSHERPDPEEIYIKEFSEFLVIQGYRSINPQTGPSQMAQRIYDWLIKHPVK